MDVLCAVETNQPYQLPTKLTTTRPSLRHTTKVRLEEPTCTE